MFLGEAFFIRRQNDEQFQIRDNTQFFKMISRVIKVGASPCTFEYFNAILFNFSQTEDQVHG